MMIKLIAVAAFAFAVATSAEAMTAAPIHQPDNIITQVAYGCGMGRTRIGGVCVARTTCVTSADACDGPATSALRGTD
jgi:hypothetical protein